MEGASHAPPNGDRRPSRVGNLWTDSAAALISSTLFATMFYPLHRVKILLQTQDSNPLVMSGQVPRYTVAGAVPRLLREGGPRELWRGAAAYMVRHVPSTTLSFAFKDAALRLLPPPPPDPDTPGQLGAAAAIHLAAGFIGGAAALFLVYPLDFATIRMAAELRQHKKSQGVMDTLNSTQRHGGVAALYRGYGVSAAAIGAYKALYFGLYDTACAVVQHRRSAAEASPASLPLPPLPAAVLDPTPRTGTDPEPPTTPVAGPDDLGPIVTGSLTPTHGTGSPVSFPHGPNSTMQRPSSASHGPHNRDSGPQAGFRGGALPPASSPSSPSSSELGVLERWGIANVVVVAASSLTYPLDVVRKRLVADTALGPGRQQYAGLRDCVAKMARAEGFRGFYRFYGYDMLLRMGGGVLLVLYDELKTYGPAGVVRQVLTLGRAEGAQADKDQEGRR